VLDIGGGGPGVAVASDLGVTTAPDNLAFTTRFTPLDPAVHALARGTTGTWAGGARLYDLDDGGAVIDPFGGGVGDDDEIRAIAIDDARGETWIATDGNGVVRLRTATGETLAVYGEDDGLPSDEVRDVAVETSGDFAGDVWIATGSGVGRWLRERDEWIGMGPAQGLVATDVRAVTIDGERWIYGGTDKAVVYIRVP
jgi:ligand-binding sensor domain-containing protein